MAIKIRQILKSMGTSLLLMLFIVVGMATGNPLLQYGGIVIVIAIQFLWMIINVYGIYKGSKIFQNKVPIFEKSQKPKVYEHT